MSQQITAITLLMRKFNHRKDNHRWLPIQKSLNKKLNKRSYRQYNCRKQRHLNLQKKASRKKAREWSQRRVKRLLYSRNSPRKLLRKLTCHRLRRPFSAMPKPKRKLSGALYASSSSVMRLRTKSTIPRFRMMRIKHWINMIKSAAAPK